MKKVMFRLLALTVATVWAAPGWAAGLTLTIHDGRVSLDAQDVTVRQILTEWARVGKTRIVNLERVTSAPVTLKFDGVPEDEALDVILRTLPGYMAAPRATLVADASIYDRILIMPTTTAVASIAMPVNPRGPVPAYQDPPGNITQLRQTPLFSPGLLPEPQDDQREPFDPALAAAAASGLIAIPATTPGSFAPTGPLQPPIRGGGPGQIPITPQPVPATNSPSNPWNAPVGASVPGLPPPPLASPTSFPPIRSGGPRPPQADQ